jgi:rare lipoprotein A
VSQVVHDGNSSIENPTRVAMVHNLATASRHRGRVVQLAWDGSVIKVFVVTASILTMFYPYSTQETFADSNQCGGASWYALPGNRTANGETMNPNAMTAAHKSLPFGTTVRVVDQSTGNAVTVTINDRGPFIKGRIIDLSRGAASKLGFKQRGHTKVCITQV